MNTDKYQAIMCFMGDVINIPHPIPIDDFWSFGYEKNKIICSPCYRGIRSEADKWIKSHPQDNISIFCLDCNSVFETFKTSFKHLKKLF